MHFCQYLNIFAPKLWIVQQKRKSNLYIFHGFFMHFLFNIWIILLQSFGKVGSEKLHYFGWLPGEDLSGCDCRFSIIFIQLDEHCAEMYLFIIHPVSVPSRTKLAEEIRWMKEIYVRETRTNCQWERSYWQIRKEREKQTYKTEREPGRKTERKSAL